MSRRYALLASVAALLPASQGARAQGWGVVPTCFQGYATAATDGCLSAPQGGTTQVPNFFGTFSGGAWRGGYAQQSGQTYAARPSWNVAGVDYGVGYQGIAVPLKDPTAGGLPTGCTYNSSTHIVTCSGANGGLTLSGWDFGNAGGSGLCVRLIVSGNVNGHIIVQNNNFANSSGNSYQCNVNNGALVAIATNAVATDVLVRSNTFDMVAQNAPYAMPNGFNPAISIGMSNGQAILIDYNAFFHLTARAIQASSTGPITEHFNYAEGMAYTYAQALHAEFSQDSAFGGTAAVKTIEYNTVLQPANAIGLETTGLLYASAGAVGNTWTTYNVNNNTLVVNQVNGIYQSLGTITILNGGSGYVSNELVTLSTTGGACTHPVVLQAKTVVSGAITVVQISAGGFCTVPPSNPASQASSSGSGTGASINITYAIASPAAWEIVIAYDTFGTLNMMNNFMDPTGSFGCFAQESSPTIGTANLSGNIVMPSGNAWNQFDVSGSSVCQ